MLRENERLDDLGDGLKIIQNKNFYSFTSDSVLLAKFAAAKKSEFAADFCAGNGVIALLLSSLTRANPIYAVELQRETADLCARSVSLSGLDDRLITVCERVQDFGVTFPREHKKLFDLITVNPPYGKKGAGLASDSAAVALARHESSLTLPELLDAVKACLTFRGRVCLVYPATRLAELFYEMKRRQIEPKRLQAVCAKQGVSPDVMLVEGVFHGAEGLRVLPTHTREENICST